MLIDLHDGKTIAVGIVALLLLAGVPFGVSELLEPEQFEHAYVCIATNELGVFLGGVSSSKLTGYPFADNRTKYSRCKFVDGTNSIWETLDKYCKNTGCDPMTFMIQNQPVEPDSIEPDQPTNQGWTPKWCCFPGGVCEKYTGPCPV